MLQPVGAGCPAVLGDGPAILAVRARDHPGHEFTGMAQRLIAGKTRRDPIQYRRELCLPPIRVYAMSRGDRSIFRCVHKLRTMPRSPPRPAQTRQHQPSRSTAAVLVRVVRLGGPIGCAEGSSAVLHFGWSHAGNQLHETCTGLCFRSSDGAPGRVPPAGFEPATPALTVGESQRLLLSRDCCCRTMVLVCSPVLLATEHSHRFSVISDE
jgi:hypothetical protein